MFPRGGSQLSLSANFTPPYSAFLDPPTGQTRLIEYHKWMFDSRNYITLAGNLVLETRAHLGFLGSYGGDQITAFERFTLGGAGLGAQGQMNFILGRDLVGLRGYADESLRPLEGTGSSTVAGGVVFNKFVMELRYPVSLSQAATIYVLGFGEAGNTWNNYAEFNPYNIKKSAGVGARIFMAAFGLIGIDWAYGFDRLPGQLKPSGSQFHFSIGQQIR
jgi:outer membrane protein insertion porin family